jgi:hydrogenase/urease accessory protein HupE
MPSCRWILALAVLILTPRLASAVCLHPPLSAIAILRVDETGSVTLTVHHDALAFALNETPQNIADEPMLELLDSGDEDLAATLREARQRFIRLSSVTANGVSLPLEIIEFPSAASIRDWERQHPQRRLPVSMDIVARSHLPAEGVDMQAITARFPEVLGEVILTIERPGLETVALPLGPGEPSPPFQVGLKDGRRKEGDLPSRSANARMEPGVLATAWRYVRLGFTHIIPEGLDHALFVVGLLVLTPRLRTVAWQITTFTIAHSVTLTLTTLHLVTLPRMVVEPTIAASIAFIGIENLTARRARPWRLAVVFVFGLVHGMGFASALTEIGLPTGQLVTGLVGFSIGVECGHMAVLAAAFLLLVWFRDRPWYRPRIAIPLSLLVAAAGLAWMAQRVLG